MRNWVGNIAILVLITVFSFSCSKERGELLLVEQIIESAPDSALTILQEMQDVDRFTPAEKALYGLLMFQALDKNYLELQPDSLINFSIQYFTKKNDKRRLGASYLYKARIFYYQMKYDQAFPFLLKALDETQDTKDFLLLGRINSDIAHVLYFQNEYALALNRYLMAYDYYEEANHQIHLSSVLLEIGRMYDCLKEFDNGLEYFMRSLSSSNDSLSKGVVLHKLGLRYYNFKELDSAYYYLKEAIKYPAVDHNLSYRYLDLSNVFFDLKQIDSANFYAYKALNSSPDVICRRECYRVLANTEYRMGNQTAVMQYLQLYQDYTDTIRKIESQTKANVLENLHQANNEVVKTKYRMLYLVLVLILLIFSTTIIGFWMLKRYKLEKQKTQEQLLLKETEMRLELLQKYRMNLHSDIEALKTEIASKWKNSNATEREEIIHDIYDELIAFNSSEAFFSGMNNALNNIPGKLLSQYSSKINDKEIRWCCLGLLNIPQTDILILLNYKSTDSLQKMKLRLATKLNIPTADLISFLEQMYLG